MVDAGAARIGTGPRRACGELPSAPTYDALGTDRYPPFSLGEEPDYPARLDERDLFDLVIGLNRRVLRVIAYATPMRDQHPPFSLRR